MSFSWCEPLCDLMFSKLAGVRSPYWCDTTAVVVVGDSTRPRAIPLAMLTMKKETLGFHNFYAWFSSVSPISIGMGFRSPALKVCYNCLEFDILKLKSSEKPATRDGRKTEYFMQTSRKLRNGDRNPGTVEKRVSVSET